MKFLRLILPLAVIGALLLWDASQRREVAALQIEIQSLRGRAEAVIGAGRRAPHSAQRRDGAVSNSGNGGAAERVAFRKRAAAMSTQELIAALDRIAGSASGREANELLEECLVGALIEQDPELALTRYGDRIPDETDGLALQLSSALVAWARKDPAAAAAWLDLKISEGLLDGKSLDGGSEARMEFEAALNGVLLASDVGAVARRLSGLPEDQRRDALERIEFSELGAEGRKAYVELLRGTIRENENAVSFDHIVSELIPEGGLGEVARFFSEIKASKEERGLAAATAASAHFEEIAVTRGVTRQDLDALLEWLERQCPEQAARISATVLAEAAADGGRAAFVESSRLLLESRAGKDNDGVLAAFLQSDAAYGNLPDALELAGRISSREVREKVIGNLKAATSTP